MCWHVTRNSSGQGVDDKAGSVESAAVVRIENTHKWQAKNEEYKNQKLCSASNDSRK